MSRQLWFLAAGGLVVVGMSFLGCLVSSSASGSVAYLPLVAKWSAYSFFVAGHAYGVPDTQELGLHPPFRGWFPEINANDRRLGVLTGDIVIRGTPANWDEVDLDLAELDASVRFAVGNHDMTDRALFVSRYGPTYYSFQHQRDLFIVLDSELDSCNITGDQWTFLQDTLSETDALNVFVFVHKLIWVAEGTPYYVLYDYLNSPVGYDFRSNFWTEVEPLFHALDAEVYVIAGDVGVPWAMSLFYDHYDNMHLIASGMGGATEENYLVFEVGPAQVDIRVQTLDGQPLERERLDAYNLDYYRDGVGE